MMKVKINVWQYVSSLQEAVAVGSLSAVFCLFKQDHHSLCSTFAGLVKAALRIWKLTVNKAMLMTITTGIRNNYQESWNDLRT